MYIATSPSEPTDRLQDLGPQQTRLQRAEGTARLTFERRGPDTIAAERYKQGAFKLLFPRTPMSRFGVIPEAVLINTAGGVTGGDRFRLDVTCRAESRAVVTTQACEKVYRSSGGDAVLDTQVTLGPGAHLDWLPQETILFDESRLRRSLNIEMAADAALLATEAVIFGRTAMGETVSSGHFQDRWRLRRDGQLVFADDTRVSGDLAAQLGRSAALGDAKATALVLYAAPDAETRLDGVRHVLDQNAASGCLAGATAFDGLLVVRMIAQHGAMLRAGLIPVLDHLRGAASLPKVWSL